MTPSLTERIAAKKAEREQREPMKLVPVKMSPWIKRLHDGELKGKDFTLGAFVPSGSERGA